MAIARDLPYLRSGFTVQIEGVPLSGVVEVTPPGGHAEIVYFREGSRPGTFRPMRGNLSLAPVVVRRAYNGLLDVFEWWQEVRQGTPTARRNVVIDLLDEEAQPVTRWGLRGAYPSSHRYEPLDAASSAPVIEVVHLVYEDYVVE